MTKLLKDMLTITERYSYATHTIKSAQVTVIGVPYDENTYMRRVVSASMDILESLMGRALKPLGRNKVRGMVTDVVEDMRNDFQDAEADVVVDQITRGKIALCTAMLLPEKATPLKLLSRTLSICARSRIAPLFYCD